MRLDPLLMPAMPLLLLLACGDKDSADSGTADPGQDDTYATTQLTDGGTWSVSYTSTPDPIPASGEFAVDVVVAEAGAPDTAVMDLEAVIVDAAMPEHGHGMNVTPVTEDDGAGTWTAYPLKFHMTGDWTITVEVSAGGNTETATFMYDCCEVGA